MLMISVIQYDLCHLSALRNKINLSDEPVVYIGPLLIRLLKLPLLAELQSEWQDCLRQFLSFLKDLLINWNGSIARARVSFFERRGERERMIVQPPINLLPESVLSDCIFMSFNLFSNCFVSVSWLLLILYYFSFEILSYRTL